MTSPRWAALVAALFFCAPAWASDCPQHFADGREPASVAAKSERELCFLAFAVRHSGTTRGPVFSAEHLEAAKLRAGHPPRKTLSTPRLGSRPRSAPRCATTPAPASTAGT
jgi:hypothetical protein